MTAIETQVSVYLLVVDYSKRVRTLVGLGKYKQCADGIIGRKFQTSYKGKSHLEAVLVYFDGAVTDQEVIAELKTMGLRPGELRELLAFGAQQPEIQCQFPIIALGAIVQLEDNIRGAPCLSGTHDGDIRQLSFTYCGGRWGGSYRFLAFRISIDSKL